MLTPQNGWVEPVKPTTGPGIVHVKFSADWLLKSSVVFEAFRAIVFRSNGLVMTPQSFSGSRMSKAGTGPFVSFTIAVIVALADFQPTLSVTVRLIVKVLGFWRVQLTMRPVASVSRSPLKSQAYPESRITPFFPTYAISLDAVPSKRTTVPSSTRSVRPFAMLPPVLFVLMFAIGSWSSTKIVMFRYEMLPPVSVTVRLTIDKPACAYVKFVRMPHLCAPLGPNLHE